MCGFRTIPLVLTGLSGLTVLGSLLEKNIAFAFQPALKLWTEL